ncbi:MAG: aspartate carbamoyltransferase catalytic subunit [Legionella sp.]|nr:aspartate carbamoyltransferase catalytic subunit [Legionella sp.]
MQHFLDIKQLSSSNVYSLIERAIRFKNQEKYPQYPQHSAATLFYENSTRTRVSFEVAAKKLAMPIYNLEISQSSATKGETLEDTLANLGAMGINCFVIRHSDDRLLECLASVVDKHLHIINAGDGQRAHPSQALLDLMTIYEIKPALQTLKVAIVGDVRHSRVANSLQRLLALVGIKELVFVAPEEWQPRTLHFGRWTNALREGIENADVVIGLRVQRERLENDAQLDFGSYQAQYGIRQETLKWARPNVMIMHPGPVNRGMEMDDAVIRDPRSVILQQVTNGVFMRMAIFESVLLS